MKRYLRTGLTLAAAATILTGIGSTVPLAAAQDRSAGAVAASPQRWTTQHPRVIVPPGSTVIVQPHGRIIVPRVNVVVVSPSYTVYTYAAPSYVWVPGFWTQQWVPQSYIYKAWVPGSLDDDGVWSEGHYEIQTVQSGGYYQPV